MIDELYDMIGGRRTIWAATESFYRRVQAARAEKVMKLLESKRNLVLNR